MKQRVSGVALVGVSSEISDEDWRQLRAMAFAALDHAYAPYSRFRVGAAVQSRDGRIYSGCNVENASYPASMCAERVAIATAVADGARDFVALVLATDAADAAPPCGLCRQVMAELGPRLEVLSCTSRGGESRWSIASLLPSPFTPHSLDRS